MEVTYEGGYLSDKFHGYGRLTQPGYAYEGDFSAGLKVGRGKEVFETGEQYEGRVLRGLHNGHGVLRATSIDGTELTYEGEFKDGMMHGKGKMKAALGTFEGEFEKGMFIRGSIRTVAGRTIEADVLKPAYFEVLPDGTRIPVNEADLLVPAD